MKITEEQLYRLNRLKCERLSSNDHNLRDVEGFFVSRNEALSDILKNDAYADDEGNKIAYYVVKDENDNMLFYFSLKCGVLFDRFIEGEGLERINSFYNFLSKMKDADGVDAQQKKSIAIIQEYMRAKKGIKKEHVQHLLHGNYAKEEIEALFGEGQRTVGETFSGIEIVHFCANDAHRNLWKEAGWTKKLGAIVFWHFIVPLVQEVTKIIGCEYLFLFAADLTDDEHLVNYYRANMQFETSEIYGAAIPLYDLTCKMMCRKTDTLEADRDAFYDYFNDEDMV